MTGDPISKKTLARLPLYLGYLREQKNGGQPYISATTIADALGLNQVQVRKDLALISNGGKPKVGYRISELEADIERFLGYDNINSAVIVGAGHLGKALMSYVGFKQYGLEINSLIDERRDPIKSSYAAAHYLKDLYNIFGDWSLVIAAYNCGPENINKAIHRADGQADYWKIYPYLPRETRGYVPAFIAANYVMNYYCEHNICPMRTTLPAKTDTVVVSKDVHLKQIADVCGIDIEELRTLNPQYRRDIVNGNNKPSVIRLPANATNTFIANEDSIYRYETDALLTRRSLVEVESSKYTTSTSKSYSKSKSRKRKSSRRSRTRKKSVTVRSGDTLSEIAERHHTTVKKLRQLNGIKGNNIRAGKKIRVK